MHLRSVLALLFALFAIHDQSHAAALQGAAIDKVPSVAIVELFTSEGCSSCPPADSLLRQINLKQTNAGQLIVGISEHVTYWNNLGWKDPYSSEVFTNRQSVYSFRLSADGPYTPQMVLNGRTQFVGSDDAALERALREAAGRDHFDLRIVSTTPTPAGMDVKFAFTGNPTRALDVMAALTDDADRSNVLRGENGGRLLQHVSVARSLTRVAGVTGDAEKSIHLSLPDGFQLKDGSGHHLILFAQEPHQGAIVGAATVAF